jgi:hypothetical protein
MQPDARQKKIHQKPASDDVSCPVTAAKISLPIRNNRPLFFVDARQNYNDV